jgi:hypothetical protein
MRRTIAVEKIEAQTLFVTDEFKASPWVKEITTGLTMWITEDPMPPGHFGTYFGALGRRTYPNRWVQDLYHLHECVHTKVTRYDASATWTEWSRKMIQAEFEASVASECFAYLHIAGLREKTFAHEIWADRFLQNASFMDGVRAGNRDALARATQTIRDERVRALNAPRFDDFLEHQIWNYCRQNVQWCRIWTENVGYGAFADKPAFRAVESHMGATDRDASHADWLHEVTPQDGYVRVPFLGQADAFAIVYKRSNAEFGNAVLLR